jgi:D-alanyl-D-alanine carboxypeptidase
MKHISYPIRQLLVLGPIFLLAVFAMVYFTFSEIRKVPVDQTVSQIPVSQKEGSDELSSHGEPVDPDDWKLLLVNPEHFLPENYSITTRELPNGKEIDKRVYPSLMKMLNDAKEQGLSLVVCSAYRSHEYQINLLEEEIEHQMSKGLSKKEAEKKAKTIVANPGTSEHETGMACDIVALSYQLLDEKLLETPEIKWLYEHCQDYGFIVRYPEGKSDVTGIIYEPWHYRYVGKKAAKEIMEKGITLEEYLGAEPVSPEEAQETFQSSDEPESSGENSTVSSFSETESTDPSPVFNLSGEYL